ncbi:hypothetical protein VCHA53O466_50192 [Vibrio chagasii]|nr:hypothetical protein VCHA53O466_50192 [Vibrio chagasii]
MINFSDYMTPVVTMDDASVSRSVIDLTTQLFGEFNSALSFEESDMYIDFFKSSFMCLTAIKCEPDKVYFSNGLFVRHGHWRHSKLLGFRNPIPKKDFYLWNNYLVDGVPQENDNYIAVHPKVREPVNTIHLIWMSLIRMVTKENLDMEFAVDAKSAHCKAILSRLSSELGVNEAHLSAKKIGWFGF